MTLDVHFRNPYQPTDEEIIEMLPSQQEGSEYEDSGHDEANPHNIVYRMFRSVS